MRCEDGNVSFKYRNAKTGKMEVRTLPGADFLWLVLQHVLPKGLRRARNFGFLHPNSAGAIRLLQVLHLRAARPAQAPPMPQRAAWRCACGAPMQLLCRRMPAAQTDASVMGQHKAGTGIRPPPHPDESTTRMVP